MYTIKRSPIRTGRERDDRGPGVTTTRKRLRDISPGEMIRGLTGGLMLRIAHPEWNALAFHPYDPERTSLVRLFDDWYDVIEQPGQDSHVTRFFTYGEGGEDGQL
jgi:hypothetical protein